MELERVHDECVSVCECAKELKCECFGLILFSFYCVSLHVSLCERRKTTLVWLRRRRLEEKHVSRAPPPSVACLDIATTSANHSPLRVCMCAESTMRPRYNINSASQTRLSHQNHTRVMYTRTPPRVEALYIRFKLNKSFFLC